MIVKYIQTGTAEYQALIDRAKQYDDQYILEQIEAAEKAGAKSLIVLGSFQDAIKNATGGADYEIITNQSFYDFVHAKRSINGDRK